MSAASANTCESCRLEPFSHCTAARQLHGKGTCCRRGADHYQCHSSTAVVRVGRNLQLQGMDCKMEQTCSCTSKMYNTLPTNTHFLVKVKRRRCSPRTLLPRVRTPLKQKRSERQRLRRLSPTNPGGATLQATHHQRHTYGLPCDCRPRQLLEQGLQRTRTTAQTATHAASRHDQGSC